MAATPVTFAQFSDGSEGTFLTNNGSGSSWVSSTLGTTGAYPIEFTFNSLSNVIAPATVQATPFNLPIAANLNYSAVTPAISTGDAYAVPTLGGGAEQNFTGITISITANGTQTIGGITIPNGANLLTMTSGMMAPPTEVGGILSGTTTTHSATFAGGTAPGGNTTIFSSDYLGGENLLNPGSFDNTDNTSEQNYEGAYALSYSNVLPDFELAGPTFSQYILALSAETTGTFSALLPTENIVPEPGTMALLIGSGVTGLSLLARRRR
jgi:hypothetical protein